MCCCSEGEKIGIGELCLVEIKCQHKANTFEVFCVALATVLPESLKREQVVVRINGHFCFRFSFCVFGYLVCVVPPMWILELDKVARANSVPQTPAQVSSLFRPSGKASIVSAARKRTVDLKRAVTEKSSLSLGKTLAPLPLGFQWIPTLSANTHNPDVTRQSHVSKFLGHA